MMDVRPSALNRYLKMNKAEREKMLLQAAADSADLYREGGPLCFGDIIDFMEETPNP
jgi:hypothetical protein